MPSKKPEPPPSESITFKSETHGAPPQLRLVHYNDIYHVDSSSAEPVGGVSRFMTLMNHYRDGQEFKDLPNLVTLFSGDAFNPSLESSVTKGA
jgi:5'-nucleotidase